MDQHSVGAAEAKVCEQRRGEPKAYLANPGVTASRTAAAAHRIHRALSGLQNTCTHVSLHAAYYMTTLVSHSTSETSREIFTSA